MSVTDHEYQPVAGHPDDPECTYRADGTDATYCGHPEWEHESWAEACAGNDVLSPREPCPHGCGCRKGTDDADRRDCACDGPCCMADDWGPDECSTPSIFYVAWQRPDAEGRMVLA